MGCSERVMTLQRTQDTHEGEARKALAGLCDNIVMCSYFWLSQLRALLSP
jgi:hypothetical protein